MSGGFWFGFGQSTRGRCSARVLLPLVAGVVGMVAATAASAGSFSQTDWSGGAAATAATDGANQNGWSRYRDKGADLLVINNGGDIAIAGVPVAVEHTTSADFAVAPSMVLHTSDADFNAGTLDRVEVSGGSVRLAPGQTNGIYTSPVIDTGTHLGYKRLFFTVSRPSGTRITRQGEVDSFMMLGVRTSSNGTTWGPWTGYANSFFLLSEGNQRYFQYKAQFDTVDAAVTPLLHDVTVTFLNYPAATDVEVICTAGSPCDGHVQLAASANSGAYESSIIDLIRPRQLSTIDFDRSVPGGASANLLVRAGSAPNPQFQAGQWTSWVPVAASGSSIASLGTYQYLQYKVELARTGAATPTLERVRVNYVGDPVAGAQVSLISSSFDTAAADAYIGAIEWVETLQQNTDVRLQIATAATQDALETSAVFVGPDGTSSTWWNSANSPSNGGCFKPGNATVVACTVMPPALRAGIDDRWFAYQVTLVANNNSNPLGPTVASVVVPYDNGVPAGVVVSPRSGLVTSESGATAVFGIVLNAAPTAPVTVNFAIDKPDELMLSANTVTFTGANWSEVQFVTFTGKDDNDLDGDQTVTISAAVAAGSDAAFVGLDIADVVVTNTDNDTLTATIVATDVNASETGPDTATFTVLLNSVAVAPLQVAFTLGDRSAVNGTDFFVTPSSPVNIATGQDRATITVTPIDDLLVEGAETVTAVLANGNGYVIGLPNSATVTIFDDEETPLPDVTVTAGSINARESDLQPGVFTISRTGATGAPLAVVYTVSGAATPGADYVALSGVAVIPGSMSSVVALVRPLDDTLAEPDETVELTLAADAGYLIAGPGSATVTIADNDASIPVIAVAATAPSAREAGQQPGTFTISHTGSTDQALAVYFSVTGSATSIVDYPALGGSVIIPAGSSSVVLSLLPPDDGTREDDETVVLTVVPGPGYALGATATATVVIADAAAAADGGASGAVGAVDMLLLWLCYLLTGRRGPGCRRHRYPG